MSSHDTWILLRLHQSLETLSITYEDALSAPPSDDPLDWELHPFFVPRPGGGPILADNARAQPGLFDHIHKAIDALSGYRYGPHATGPIPLAVFVDPPKGQEEAAWEEAVERLLETELDLNRIEVVRLGPEKDQPRPPFRLPLRILAVGLDSVEALRSLRMASWYADSAEVQAYGLHFDFADPGNLPRALRKDVQDIVVVDETAIESFLQATVRLRKPTTTRPRLLILLDRTDFVVNWAKVPLPPGLSLLRLPTPSPSNAAIFLNEFIHGIIHDYPLHEATHATKWNYPWVNQEGWRMRLRATPRSNQALRMSDALDLLQTEARVLDEQFDLGQIDAFLNRLDLDNVEPLRNFLTEAQRLKEPIKKAADTTRQLQGDFSRETFGLVPMAEAEASVARARLGRRQVQDVIENILSDSALVEAVRQEQDRRVDIALEYLDEIDIYRPLNVYDLNYSLVCGQHYRMRLHIGHRLENSAMIGEVPPIDPLLPEPESEEKGHQLDVAVFEAGFALLSPRLQPLYLPPLSGSEPVYFKLRAPAQPGSATLRIGIYNQNHLVQSFLLETNVQLTSSYGNGERQVQSRLVLARSAHFTNLDDLKPRTLSIGINQDANGRTHSFMLKKDKVAAEPIRLTERLLEEQVHAFRTLLEKESYLLQNGKKASRFNNDALPGAQPSEDFKEVIRKLADFGGGLYRQIFTNASGAMKKKLRTLAYQTSAEDDETTIIQIIRHDPNFAFPWPVLYDYPLPRKVSGAPPKAVCMGAPIGNGPSSPSSGGLPKGCPHNPGHDVYCIEGFWGIRHQLEQLIEQGDSLKDVPPNVRRPADRSAVYLIRGIHNKFTQTLATTLRQQLDAVLVEIGPEDDLLNMLWDAQKRPALMVLIAHLETKDRPGEPIGPRIIPFPKKDWQYSLPIPPEKWLQEQGLFEYVFEKGPWEEQPRPVVLLIACDSAATEITSLNDFVKSFTSAGAGSIVGTECEIFSSLGARFAREITLDLWQGTSSLGQAVHKFNKRILASGNPMAFAFSCFGNADIKFVT